MSLFRPTELRQFLSDLGKRPSRALSQNFLIDGNILRKIIAFANIQPNDSVLEIGAGPGALTQMLLQTGAPVLAVEKDSVFATALNRLQTTPPQLSVISRDFLELDLTTLFTGKAPIKVVANIPYNITTPIILHLIPHYQNVDTITLMVQREVALRLTAKKGTADYSSLTLLLQYYADVKFGFNIEPTCFYPPPTVRSSVVQIRLKKPRQEPYPEQFIRAAFQQRRKTIRSSVKNLYPNIGDALENLRLNPNSRPEELSLDEFIALDLLLK
jgi:16S rRNA (adenine1518-N6/adenine1519-N6)-dimethyltransferase